ncbi:hypothetical protein C0583_00910 [Candidatus Parcubacteria bacterium]|nr:MAG: hypothetical protein C0583_00910 [Candidatus Parcubacteria bacterium]
MINYLEKYKNLPKELRDRVSTPAVMEAIHELEQKYNVKLATIIMRVMVRDIEIERLHSLFVYENGLDDNNAKELIKELNERVFSSISAYLDYIHNSNVRIPTEEGAKQEPVNTSNTKNSADFYFSAEDEEEVRSQAKDLGDLDKRELIAKQVENKIDQILAEVNVIFSSEDMMLRLRQILKTYLKGVRNKIDTISVLKREIENGGLALDDEIADDILKVVDLIKKDEAEHPGRPLEEVKKIDFEKEEKIKIEKENINNDVPYDFSGLQNQKNIKTDEQDPVVIDTQNNIEEKESLMVDSLEVENEPNVEKEEQEDKTKNTLPDHNFGEISPEEKSSNIDLRIPEEKEEVKDENKEELVFVSDKIASDSSPADNNSVIEQEQKEGEKKEEEKEMVIDLKAGQEDNNQTEVLAEKTEEGSGDVGFKPGMMAKARNSTPSNNEFKERFASQFNSQNNGKVRMEDIKHVSKLSGPEEELASMTLVDFRRLGDSPNERIDKIINMLNLLEEESFSKRMIGIKAWRKSPLNTMYRQLGQESMTKQKDIRELLYEKDESECMSKEEFDAVMQLNKKLRY